MQRFTAALFISLHILLVRGQSTGFSCITSCVGLADGDYQSCQDCNIYASCTNGDIIDRRPCPADLVWDDNIKRCEYVSPTCTPPTELQATCVIEAGSGVGAVEGTFTLTQTLGQDVIITLNLEAVGTPGSEHGFHVHENGNLGNSCSDAGGHYNPFGLNHGAPGDDVRHVGDLGNIVAGGVGEVVLSFTDSLVTLYGTRSVIGRAIVVHADRDDLGLGGVPTSLTTGNSGARLGCCVINI